MKTLLCLLFVHGMLVTTHGWASLSKALGDVVRKAAQTRYPRAEITVSVPELPPFLKQRPCEHPKIELKSPTLLHRVAVALKCADNAPWSAYITVSVAAKQPVPVLCQPVPRGHQLINADLCERVEDLARLPPLTLTEPQAIVGLETRRALAREATLQPGVLGPPKLVARGDTVSLEAGTGSIRISARASARSDGRLGEQIQVTNLQSGKRLRAWVIGAGRVSTRPPS